MEDKDIILQLFNGNHLSNKELERAKLVIGGLELERKSRILDIADEEKRMHEEVK